MSKSSIEYQLEHSVEARERKELASELVRIRRHQTIREVQRNAYIDARLHLQPNQVRSDDLLLFFYDGPLF
jgi:hypothetical protein